MRVAEGEHHHLAAEIRQRAPNAAVVGELESPAPIRPADVHCLE
jgi:hypothetical protein